MAPRDTLIVGAGRAGMRFLRASLVARPAAGLLAVRAIVDPCADRRSALAALGVRTHSTLADAWRAQSFDLVIVAVNESEHHATLMEIAGSVPVASIVVEKPMTRTLEEARQVAGRFRGRSLEMMLVERTSRAVAWARSILLQRGHVVTRATFCWGKNRLGDPRPTMGALSELIHPLDLCLLMGNVPTGMSYEVSRAHSTTSLLAPGMEACEAVKVEIRFASGLVVRGSSSYAWPVRCRQIRLLSGPRGECATHSTRLAFDDPVWDIDRGEMRAVDGPLTPEPTLRVQVERADIAPARLTIDKVVRTLERAGSGEDDAGACGIVEVDRALYLQAILEQIEAVSSAGGIRRRARGAVTFDHGRLWSEGLEASLDRILKGEALREGDYIWDDGY